MTTLTATRPSATTIAEPRARFRDLIAAEWIKLWSLRSTYWALGLAAVLIVGIGANAAAADYHNYPSYGRYIRELFIPYWALRDAFSLGACVVLMLAAGSIGTIAIVSEYGTGLIRTTFAAVPARRSVLAAKLVTVTAVLAAFGAAVTLTSFFVSQAILDGRHVGMSISDPGVLRSLAISALVAPICGVIGMGLGTAIRHTASAIVTTIFALILLPILIPGSDHRFVTEIRNAMPMLAWQYLSAPGHPYTNPHMPTAVGSWIVYAAWPLAAAILALTVVHRRDL